MKFGLKELIFENDGDKKYLIEVLEGLSKNSFLSKKSNNHYSNLTLNKVTKDKIVIYRGNYFVTNKKIEEYAMIQKGIINSLTKWFSKSKGDDGLLEIRRFFQFFSIFVIENKVFMLYEKTMVGGLSHKSLFIFLKTQYDKINIVRYDSKFNKKLNDYIEKMKSKKIKHIEFQCSKILEEEEIEIIKAPWIKKVYLLEKDLDFNPKISFSVKNIDLVKALEILNLDESFDDNIDFFKSLYITFKDGTKKNLASFLYEIPFNKNKVQYIENNLNDNSKKSIYEIISNKFIEDYKDGRI